MKLMQYEILRQAIRDYISEKELFSEYETVSGGNSESVYLGVFDLPDNYDSSLGLINDGPEYRAKPVLIARMGIDGYAYVEETEYTHKYLQATKAVAVAV